MFFQLSEEMRAGDNEIWMRINMRYVLFVTKLPYDIDRNTSHDTYML